VANNAGVDEGSNDGSCSAKIRSGLEDYSFSSFIDEAASCTAAGDEA
jgi:hypothetical protein